MRTYASLSTCGAFCQITVIQKGKNRIKIRIDGYFEAKKGVNSEDF